MATIESSVTIVLKYLDCRERFALAGGVSSLADDSEKHEAESRTTSTNERSDRVRRSWQLSWGDALRANRTDTEFLYDLFEVCRNSKGFLFVSPLETESAAEDQPLKNIATGGYTGNGVATTFQLQRCVTISHDIGSGSTSSDLYDIVYPLADTVVVYADGTPVAISGVSETTGVVTLSSAPSNGAVMTADYEYAVPVLLVSPTVSRSMIEATNTEVRSVQIEEIF